jgi:8-oxo-dGTP pyrophosphatase MutT (NUDIX family)
MESHYTATGLVINCAGDKALLVFHKKLQLWLPAGGHVEEGELPHQAVVREVFEETGVNAQIVHTSDNLDLSESGEIQFPAPQFVLHEFIPAYKGKDAHMHYDFIYQMQAQSDECTLNQAECESVGWFTKEQLLACNTTAATRQMYKLCLKDK